MGGIHAKIFLKIPSWKGKLPPLVPEEGTAEKENHVEFGEVASWGENEDGDDEEWEDMEDDGEDEVFEDIGGVPSWLEEDDEFMEEEEEEEEAGEDEEINQIEADVADEGRDKVRETEVKEKCVEESVAQETEDDRSEGYADQYCLSGI